MPYAAVMVSRHRLAELASLLADPGRAGMALALWDGRARPAGELARIAGVTPATASSHLARLVAGGVLRVEPRVRHRYYRLAGDHVAGVLESLAQALPPRASRESADTPRPALHRARLCYDHLAGALGVGVADALQGQRALELRDCAWVLPPRGRAWFERFGI